MDAWMTAHARVRYDDPSSIFRSFDVSADGTLSLAEFDHALQRMGMGLTKIETAKLMSVMDKVRCE